MDITYVCMDNSIYGLTKGQVSPTTPTGEVTKTSPYGNIEEPMNPVLMALACGATFIARSFSADVKTSVELIAEAIEHRGILVRAHDLARARCSAAASSSTG